MLAWWRNSLLSRHNISHIHNKYQRAISGNYKTLQEFSSRKQQHLSVPANPHTVIAPVSGFAISEQISNPEQEICLYAEKSTIKDLLEHPRLIDSFCPGVMVAHRIPHYESHRIHMPLSGSITAQITTDYNGGSKTFLVIETAVHTSLLLCILTRDFTQKAILTYNQNKNYHLAGEEIGAVNGPPVTVFIFAQDEALILEDDLRRHSNEGYETELNCGHAIAQTQQTYL